MTSVRAWLENPFSYCSSKSNIGRGEHRVTVLALTYVVRRLRIVESARVLYRISCAPLATVDWRRYRRYLQIQISSRDTVDRQRYYSHV